MAKPFRLMLAADYRACDDVFFFFPFSSLFTPQGHWAFITESKSFSCLISPWIQWLTQARNLTHWWYLYPCTFPASLSHSQSVPALSLQRRAPLDWRIWVIWTTKEPLDTGAQSANTTQLDVQMMTAKVFCGLTLGWNQSVDMVQCRNICGPA